MTVKSLIKKLKKVKDKSAKVWIHDMHNSSYTKIKKLKQRTYNKKPTIDIIYDTRITR